MNERGMFYIYLLGQKKMDRHLNKVYDKHKIQMYKHMKNSEYRNLQFVKAASIDREIQFNKAIGAIEYISHLENTVKKSKIMEVVTEGLGNALSMTYREVIDILNTNNEWKINKYITNIAKDDRKDFLTELAMVTFLVDERLYQKYFVDGTPTNINFLRHTVEMWTYNREIGKDMVNLPEVVEMRHKFFPVKDAGLSYFYYKHRHIDDGEFMKFAETIEILSGNYFLDFYTLGDQVPLSKKDFGFICHLAIGRKIPEDQMIYFLWTAFIMVIMAKQFHAGKALFFQNNSLTMELEEKVSKSKEKEYLKIIKELEEKNKALGKKLESKEKEIEKVRKEYRGSLEKELAEKEADIEYLESLIEELNQRSQDEDQEKDQVKVEIKELKPFMIEDQVYIAGGYPTLIQKLKSYFPNLIHISNSAADIQRYKGQKIFLLTQFTQHKTRFLFESLKDVRIEFVNKIGVNQIADEIRNMLENK